MLRAVMVPRAGARVPARAGNRSCRALRTGGPASATTTRRGGVRGRRSRGWRRTATVSAAANASAYAIGWSALIRAASTTSRSSGSRASITSRRSRTVSVAASSPWSPPQHVVDLTEIDPRHQRLLPAEQVTDDLGRGAGVLQVAEDRPRVEDDGHGAASRARSADRSCSSSWVIADPRNRPRSGRRRSAGRTATWSSWSQKLTSSPGSMPSWSRSSLGMTTCPLGPTR